MSRSQSHSELTKRLIADGLKPQPAPISEARRWLARQLMDPALSDSEVFGIVAYHPSVKDQWK